MTSTRTAASALLALGLLAAPAHAAPATQPATRPLAPAAAGLTADATRGDVADYVRQVEAFVEANPTSPDAGPALMNGLTAATAAGDEAAVSRLQRRILWDYYDGVQAAYLLETNDADKLRPVFESFLPEDW